MSRVSIECPHCGKKTHLDLAHNLSTQKCDRCGVSFRAVNTGLAGSREVQFEEPPDWRRAKTGDWDLDPEEAEASVPVPASTGSRGAWIAVIAALGITAITALAVTRRPPAAPPVQPVAADQAAVAGAAGSAGASTYPELRARFEQAAAAATRYLSVRSLDELLPLIENRESLEPQVRQHYTEGEGRNQLPFPAFTLAPTEYHVWVDHMQTAIITYDVPGQVARAVALRLDPGGQWLVDWPSAAVISEMPLEEFRARRDTTPRFFRLLGVRDDYFNHLFGDDREWLCLRLSDVTLTQRIYAYARRGSDAAKALVDSRLPRGSISTPVMLRIRFPEHAPSDDQVEIVEFLGLGWIEQAPPPPPPPTGPDGEHKPSDASYPSVLDFTGVGGQPGGPPGAPPDSEPQAR